MPGIPTDPPVAQPAKTLDSKSTNPQGVGARNAVVLRVAVNVGSLDIFAPALKVFPFFRLTYAPRTHNANERSFLE
jgi:hypothetical protein